MKSIMLVAFTLGLIAMMFGTAAMLPMGVRSASTSAIARAQADGYTIGMGTASTLAINPAVYKNLTFDVLTDLTPIGNIAAVPNIMALSTRVKANNMMDFIALARTEPDKLSYASPGLGSVAHLLGEQFKLCLLYTSPSPRDRQKSRMPSSA